MSWVDGNLKHGNNRFRQLPLSERLFFPSFLQPKAGHPEGPECLTAIPDAVNVPVLGGGFLNLFGAVAVAPDFLGRSNSKVPARLICSFFFTHSPAAGGGLDMTDMCPMDQGVSRPGRQCSIFICPRILRDRPRWIIRSTGRRGLLSGHPSREGLFFYKLTRKFPLINFKFTSPQT